VPAVTALASPAMRPEAIDAEALEQLVLVCLEVLARLAQARGHRTRAARLHGAAGLLRQRQTACPAIRLTSREWDVALRVAGGASNRQIALELVVSERTVDTHVSHILNKLDLVSRAQIAAWVVQRHPALPLRPAS
jgi:DNA-binding NarL/FixJ family response regulator